MSMKEEALRYHSEGRKGKIEVIATKPFLTSRDLSLAYSPGVAEPCKEIAADKEEVYNYTAKGNLVGVVSNGTAVLGLGNIGPEASKPVMEGKGVLFKRFADIDVFDIEVNTLDPKEVIRVVELLEPTFGGINLEDIKAPECFEIEEVLKKTVNIPVFHDDQHGTAIISCAALLNACELVNKKLEDIRVVVVGAGAAGIASIKLYVKAGVKKENIALFDSKGLIHKDRTDLNKYKLEFAIENKYSSLEHALEGADAFLGLSVADLMKPEMLRKMAKDPIVFALANPDPEIPYDIAVQTRSDIIMATGRSDFPNQVNNVLGFPFIFRGALDVRATGVNEEMKLAAVKALAQLTKEDVPDLVVKAYGGEKFSFGREYIIPKPFDPRVLWTVAPAVAKAAVDSGVAKKPITDWDAYSESLKERLGYSEEVMRIIIHKARNCNRKVVYPDGEEEVIIRAANKVAELKIGQPILLGNKVRIQSKIEALGFESDKFTIIDPTESQSMKNYIQKFYELRQRKGVNKNMAKKMVSQPNYFACMMVAQNDADVLIGGINSNVQYTLKPALETIGMKDKISTVSGMYIAVINRKVLFFADINVNINPNADELAQIAISASDAVKEFDFVPIVGMLSFSNFGSTRTPESNKIKDAVRIVQERRPDIVIDGEMQVDTALDFDILKNEFPFNNLPTAANVLIFPNLSAANISYRLLQKLTNSTFIGPVLMGLNKPVHVVDRAANVDDVINMTALAVVESVSKN